MKTLYALAALSLIVAGPALSQPADTRRLAVSYADLDLKTSGGQAELVARIRRAAERVCAPIPDQRDVKALMAFERCMKKSVDTAVAAIPTTSRLAAGD
ncbi:MAG: UrcA family protein [Caulobacteraceae bacterium]